jgi:hypothetical protein
MPENLDPAFERQDMAMSRSTEGDPTHPFAPERSSDEPHRVDVGKADVLECDEAETTPKPVGRIHQ